MEQTEKTMFIQLRWKPSLKKKFSDLVKTYDSHLSLNLAILKLVEQSIKDHYIPGYERIKRGGVISGGLESVIPTRTDHSIELRKTIDTTND